MATRWLNCIKHTFDATKALLQKYKCDPNTLGNPQILDTNIETNGINRTTRNMHRRIHQVDHARTKPRKRDAIDWAIYNRQYLAELIDTIATLTKNLVTAFPKPIPAQTQSEKLKLGQVHSSDLGTLDRALPGDQDPVPDHVLQAFQKPDNTYMNLTIDGQSVAQWGDSVASGERHRGTYYGNIKAGGQATAHLGRTIGNFPRGRPSLTRYKEGTSPVMYFLK